MAERTETESNKKIEKPDVSAARCLTGDLVPILNSWTGEQPKLICADPPFNFGMAYGGYNDKKPKEQFREWLYSVLAACDRILHPEGSLWFFLPEELVSYADVYCQEKLGLHLRRHCIWTYTFGQAARKNFTKSCTHLLYFVKHKTKFTFNSDVMRVPSARQLVYKDSRALAGGKMPDATWCLLKSDLEQALRADGDVFLASRVCGSFKQRKAHCPNQIPVSLLSRIVLATSNPGDLVLDPCAGTFSTGEAALRHGRRFIGIDIDGPSVLEGRKRLEKIDFRPAADKTDQLSLFPPETKKQKKGKK